MIADRAVQLLQAPMPEPDDLRGQLVQLRTHVRRRDVRGAEALIDLVLLGDAHLRQTAVRKSDTLVIGE